MNISREDNKRLKATRGKYTEQKKLRKSQKSMQHKETIANNYSIFIYLFRYMSSVDKKCLLKFASTNTFDVA